MGTNWQLKTMEGKVLITNRTPSMVLANLINESITWRERVALNWDDKTDSYVVSTADTDYRLERVTSNGAN